MGRLPPAIALDPTHRATLSPEKIEFFDLFGWFPVALENEIAETWTIDPADVHYVRRYGFGRRFVVFYNRIEMGEIDISPYFNSILSGDDGVYVSIRLRYLMFVPFADACNLVSKIELHCGPFSTRETSMARAEGAASAALTKYLWDTVRTGAAETPIFFEHEFSGSYTLFRETVGHWTKNNVNPEELYRYKEPY